MQWSPSTAHRERQNSIPNNVFIPARAILATSNAGPGRFTPKVKVLTNDLTADCMGYPLSWSPPSPLTRVLPFWFIFPQEFLFAKGGWLHASCHSPNTRGTLSSYRVSIVEFSGFVLLAVILAGSSVNFLPFGKTHMRYVGTIADGDVAAAAAFGENRSTDTTKEICRCMYRGFSM